MRVIQGTGTLCEVYPVRRCGSIKRWPAHDAGKGLLHPAAAKVIATLTDTFIPWLIERLAHAPNEFLHLGVISHFKNWTIMHTDYRRPLKTFETTISAVVGLHFYRTV